MIAAGSVLVLAVIATNEAAIEFLWRYIAGPLVTHAKGAAVSYSGVTAAEGYNIYNTALYAIALVGFIAGLDRLLDRWDIGDGQDLVIGMVPFVIMGGMLRVLEDTGTIGYPLNLPLITPLIYFLVAGLAVGCLYGSVILVRKGWYESYRRPLLLSGIGGIVITAALLAPTAINRFSAGTAPPAGIGAVLLITVAALLGAVGLQRYLGPKVPETFLNTTVGETAVIAQVMDGAVTAGSLAFLGYGEKHVVSRYLIETLGTPYAFLGVKAAFIIGILAYLPEEDDRLSMLIMLGVIAVGMGPAVRNLTRAILGI
jgi:uncharacterized membrane protein